MAAFWLLSLLVFGLFGWMLFKAYRYTTLSVGTESPEFHRVTRTFPAWRYFTRTTPLWLGFMFVMWVMIAYLMLTISYPDIGAIVVMMVSFILLGGMLFLCWMLELQYWDLVRGVAVTYDPQAPSIEVEGAGDKICINPTDVEKVEIHTPPPGGHLFTGYEYVSFFLRDGRVVRLSRMFFFEHEFLQKYFGNVPFEHHQHRIPWVNPLPVSS